MGQLEKSSEQRFGASPVEDAGQSQKWRFGQAFQSERPSGGGLETEASAPVGEVGQSQKTGVVPPRPDLPINDWIALLACLFRYLGRPMSCVLSAWDEPLLGSRSTRDLGFMNPTGAPEPPGDSGRIIWGFFCL